MSETAENDAPQTLCGGCEWHMCAQGKTILRLAGRTADVCERCGYHANLRLAVVSDA